MEDSSLDKSEQPTTYKLHKARERGVVARGMDLGFLTSIAALFGYMSVEGPQLGAAVSRVGRDAFIGGPALADSPSALINASMLLFAPMIRPMLLLIILVFLVVLVFEIVQTGFVFSAKPLTPDFNRLNPANGLKRLFSIRLLIETIKNVLKLVVYTAIACLIIRTAMQSDAAGVTDARGLFALLQKTGVRLLGAFVLAAVLFMALDQVIARWQFVKKMRMDRRELRQEARDREGEPRMKQKRKQLHREFTKASQSLRNLRRADVLITNPQHIALGLHYDASTMHAPSVVAMGTNQFAQRLKRLAFLYGIPVFENKPLAHELYRRAVLERPIPESCFRPVADIYNAIRRRTQIEPPAEIGTTAAPDGEVTGSEGAAAQVSEHDG
jgi:flagellar biosynthetic protein FlhB